MSVKHLSNQACEVCKQDTLHKVCVCQTCGNIKETPWEQRRKANRRLYARYNRFYGDRHVTSSVIYHQGNKGKPADASAYKGDWTAKSDAKFGKGKARTKI